MSKTLYIECSRGISGDMFVASLIDLGVDREYLLDALNSIPADGYKVEISTVQKSGVAACDFNVILDSEIDNHDHDMEYLYGHMEASHSSEDHHEHEHGHHHHDHDEHHEHEHHHDHEHHHHHDGHHEHGHHHHHHEHRNLDDVKTIIAGSNITDNAKALANKIFDIVAIAESKAHNKPLSEVHFHEVGAIDSIVDVIAAAVCIDYLGYDYVISSPLTEGQGTVRCQHGILPIPVPAVANIIADNHVPISITNTNGELVTPTGAAIIAAIANSYAKPESFIINKIGIGAGKRNYEIPSLLRAYDITTDDEASIYKLETNIDDSTGETLSNCMELLLEAGARDVYFTPIYMKKNRPATMLSVICDENLIEPLENVIFMNTSTIGIRRMKIDRRILSRELVSVKTSLGDIKGKKVILPDGSSRVYPEFDSIKAVARDNSLTISEVTAEFIKNSTDV